MKKEYSCEITMRTLVHALAHRSHSVSKLNLSFVRLFSVFSNPQIGSPQIPLAAQAGMFVSSPVLRVLREHWASPTKLKLSFETLWERWASAWSSVLIDIRQEYSFFILIFGLENLMLFSMSIWNNIFYLHSMYMYMYVFPIYFYHIVFLIHKLSFFVYFQAVLFIYLLLKQ